MEILKVDVPLYKVIPVRQAKLGQVLEGDVFGRNDEFIAERGTEIDEKLLSKFDNFNVRRLTIREHQETWVPDEQRARLPSDAQVLREEVFEGELEAPVRSLFGEGFEKEMIRLLEAMIEELGDREENGLVDLREDVDELVDEVDRVRKELGDLPENTRNRVRNVLAGSVIDLGKNFLQLPGPDKQLRRYLDLFKHRDRLRRAVIEQLSARPELVPEGEYSSTNGSGGYSGSGTPRDVIERELEDLDVTELPPGRLGDLRGEAEDVLEEQREVARELEGIEEFEKVRQTLDDAAEENVLINPKTLASITDGESVELTDRVKKLIERRKELQSRIKDAASGPPADDDSKGTGEDQQKNTTPDKIKGLLDQFDAGKRFLAVKNTVDFVRDQEANLDGYVDRLKELMRTLKDYRSENQTLHEKVEESARNPGDREYLERLMDGEEPFDPDRLLGMDVDMMLVEQIETHLNRRDQIQGTFEEIMWDLKTNSSVEE